MDDADLGGGFFFYFTLHKHERMFYSKEQR